MTKLRVLVAGAGAVGSAIALQLARAGARVTLADPAPLGANASGVAAGMMAPAFESLFDPGPGEYDILMRARGLWPEFARAAGIEIDRSGAMAVGSQDEVDAWAAGLEALGAPGERLKPEGARLRSPWLAEGLDGLWTGEDWRLDSVEALRALQSAVERTGGERRQSAVRAFAAGRAVLSDGAIIVADALVIATGAGRALASLAPELGDLSPIKGHILRAPAQNLAGPAVRFSGGYICPHADGAIIGATMEPGRDDDIIDPVSIQAIRQRAARALPAALTVGVDAAVGIRATTSDRRPIVGPSVTPGVWLAAGARRNGWLLAPLIAETIAGGLLKDVVEAMEDARPR